MQHEYCINGKELQKVLIEKLTAAREKEKQLGLKPHPVAKAYINAEINLWEQVAHNVGKLLKDNAKKGALDMTELRKGLVVKTINLEDLNLRRLPNHLEKEMMEIVGELKPPRGNGLVDVYAVDVEKMEPRSLNAYLGRLRRKKLLKDLKTGLPKEAPDVRLRKEPKSGEYLLVRYE